MSLPPIPAELLHLCETEREAVRRYAEAYALQAVQALRREPMTDEQAAECINNAKTSLFDRDGTTSFRIVRAVEAHHHITQKENVSQQRTPQKAMTLQEADEDFELDNYEIDGQGE